MRSEHETFSYELVDSFFKLIDAEDVHAGNIHVDLDVKHTAGAFQLTFQIDGDVCVTCDRCLDDIVEPIETEDTVYVKLGEQYEELDNNLIVIPEHDGHINVAWLMYEFIVLALPIQRIHPEGECNEEMREKLNELLCENVPEDEDASTAESENTEEGDTDPRWNELKKLLNNN